MGFDVLFSFVFFSRLFSNVYLLCDHLPSPPVSVSEASAIMAKRRVNLDLWQVDWHSRLSWKELGFILSLSCESCILMLSRTAVGGVV
jgi:hypothetical protein